ncbi:MAG: transcriptional regulator [Peptococcaceae bacterium BICA1-7]|nr:MAG: transcriptional regulator [Peptococcaceae bacterium BICA1-7]HBV95610.1 DNA-binding response regulator [Desulfotomaculum sp.]
MKILVVDDEDKIRNIIRMYFTREGYGIGEAANGREALDRFKEEKYDLIVLDIMMPDMDGWEVCRRVRAGSSVPIIMLTAKGEEVDRIVGLEMGADDYMVKPFSPRELLARVKAVLRRTARDPDSGGNNELKAAGAKAAVQINIETRSVTVCGQTVPLTVKEFDLMCYMSRHPGRAYTRDELLQGVWGFDYYGDTRTVDTHINRLRDKLNKVPGCPDVIRTVWGVGYKFEVVE